MKHTIPAQTLSLIFVALTSSYVFAAPPAGAGMGPVPFESMDTDNDGFVSGEEFNHMRSERIRSRAAEQRQFRNMKNMPGFTDIDTDGDGKLNREEMQNHHRNRQQFRQERRKSMGRPIGNERGRMGNNQ